jgi:subtilase family serine protease
MKHRIVTYTILALLSVSTLPVLANGVTTAVNLVSSVRPHPGLTLLDKSFNPSQGGLPFCKSGGLGSILCYTPSFLKTAYNVPNSLDGTGQTIVIVDAFGSPTAQSDLNTYDTVFGLPSTSITILCGPTWTGSASDTCPVFDPSLPIDQACGAVGWWEETTLDLQMSHGIAPGAKIVLVVSNDCQDTSFNAAEGAVVNNPAYHGAIMSQSFGEPDDLVGCSTVPCPGNTVDHSIRQTADKIYNQARINGWTVIASSGDDGANEALSAAGTIELTPSWPATNPLNIAAGGTQGNPYGGQYGAPPGPGGSNSCPANTNCNTGLVVINGGATGCQTAPRPGVPTSCTPVGYGGEATWNEFNVFGVRTASGGGVSPHYGLPSYQMHLLPKTVPTILGATVPTTGRLTPDISFNSAIDGGFLSFIGFLGAHGAYGVFGGTSAASPALAGIVALANQAHGSSLGFITTAIYQLAESSSYSSAFHDITAGENSDTAGQFGIDGFAAGTGYDLATGWGTPNVANFIAGLNTICSPQCPGP